MIKLNQFLSSSEVSELVIISIKGVSGIYIGYIISGIFGEENAGGFILNK